MKRLWIAIPTAVVVGVLNVFAFFLFMVLFSYVIDPGHDEPYYQTAAQRFGPVSSIAAGIPLMFAAGYWISRRFGTDHGMIAAFAVWGVYFVLDLLIVAMSGHLFDLFPLFFISFATKMVAVLAGAQYARGRAESLAD